ncbi:hypothetical protein KX729_16220 [Rhizobium sp. XQZ8]|uniref:hypothetical protein n=1 Tax=Rhizobium populisoli TaxID=2859785 RepID=UPI001CA58083|nr:hypothetical protein [Rhizobium populisoli]MBW6423005.1 hypothetical protein [Rhizobium populisoli]
MKRTLLAAGILALSSSCAVYAAEVNEQGAKSLKDSLSYFLPDRVKKNNFLSVKPSGDRYEITYDFARLLSSIDKKKDFTVSGLTPFSVFAAPMDNGQWKLNSDSDMNFAVRGKLPDGKQTNLTYSVTDMVFSGIFDPAISYLSSGQATSGPIRMVSKSGPEEIEASFAGMNYSMTSEASKTAGATNFSGKGSFQRFYERVVTPEAPPIQIRADSLDFDASVEGVAPEKMRNLISLMIEMIKDEKPSQADVGKLKDLIRGAMPFFTSLSEKLSFNQFKVEAPMGEFGLGKLDYTLAMTEPSDKTRIGIGARIEDISTPSGLVPRLYEQLIPNVADIEVGIADLNFTRFVNELMAMDFSKPGPLPDAEGEKLGRAFLNDGQLTIDFPKVSAKSDLYDIEASGKIRGYPEEKDRYTIETTVYARDIDKLIQYFQKSAKSDPQLSQASFGVMMAKGMAKTEPDGRLRWDIEFSDGNSLTVNGQVLK